MRNDNAHPSQLILHIGLDKAGSTSVLLSWEGLNFYSRAQIASLQSQLPDLPIVVVVYVREQAEIVQSGFLQEIKRLANTCPITTFQSRTLILRLRQQRKARYPASRDYYQLLRRWEKGLSATMRVRVFDRALLQDGDVVADFLHALGVEPDARFHRLSGLGNPSLDAVSAWLIDLLRQQGVDRKELEELVDVALSVSATEGGGERYFLDRETVEKIRTHFAASNEKLAADYLPGVEKPFDTSKPAWPSNGEAGLRAQLMARMNLLGHVAAIPVFSGEGLAGEAIAEKGLLQSGWQKTEPWGCWCDGNPSRLYFRVYRQRILPQHSHLHIYVRGQYRSETASTRLIINGEDFGEQRLGHDKPGVDLSLADLGDYDTVSIELQHQGDFALEFFGFEPRESGLE